MSELVIFNSLQDNLFMLNDKYRVLLGAADWRHTAWQGQFYPQDLPEEWQLAYYANEFPVVLIRQQQLQVDEVEEWLENSDESLLFLYELDLCATDTDYAASLQNSKAAIELLGSRCAGLLIRLESQQANDQSYLLALVSACQEILPLCIDCDEELSLDSRELLQQHQIGWCWHGTDDESGLVQGALAVCRVESNGLEPRTLRKYVESCINVSSDHRRVILIFDGLPPDTQVMQNAKIIYELL